MSHQKPEPDQDICPLCGKPNGCEHHCGGADENDCWCHHIVIPRDFFKLIPPEAVGKACVCKNCLIKYGAKVVKSS